METSIVVETELPTLEVDAELMWAVLDFVITGEPDRVEDTIRGMVEEHNMFDDNDIYDEVYEYTMGVLYPEAIRIQDCGVLLGSTPFTDISLLNDALVLHRNS